MENNVYVIYGTSQYDYELKNIVFGIYDSMEKAKENLNNLEQLKEDDEIELYIVSYKKNTINENNVNIYLKK